MPISGQRKLLLKQVAKYWEKTNISRFRSDRERVVEDGYKQDIAIQSLGVGIGVRDDVAGGQRTYQTDGIANEKFLK